MDFKDYTDFTVHEDILVKALEIIEKLAPKDKVHFEHLWIEECRRIPGAFDIYNMFGMYSPEQRHCTHMLCQVLTNQFKVPVSYIMGDNFIIWGCSVKDPIMEIARRKREIEKQEVAHA